MAPHGPDPLVSCSLRGYEAPGRLQGSLVAVTSSDLCGKGQGPRGEVREQRASGWGPGRLSMALWELAPAGVWGCALCGDPQALGHKMGSAVTSVTGTSFLGGSSWVLGVSPWLRGRGQGSGVCLPAGRPCVLWAPPLVLVDNSLGDAAGMADTLSCLPLSLSLCPCLFWLSQ